jgi:hypothetical protein
MKLSDNSENIYDVVLQCHLKKMYLIPGESIRSGLTLLSCCETGHGSGQPCQQAAEEDGKFLQYPAEKGIILQADTGWLFD